MSSHKSDEDPIDANVYRMTIELLEEYRSEFSSQPSIKAVRRIWSNFVTLGSLGGKKRPGRPQKALREECEVMLRDTDMSLRQISRSLASVGVSSSKDLVHKVAKSLKLRFSIKPVAQLLTEAQIKRRFDFAHSMNKDIRKGLIDVKNIIFTDECMIGIDPSSNRQNDGVWRVRGEFDDWREQVRGRQVRCKAVHVFVAIHAEVGVVGPVCIDEIDPDNPTLDGPRYVEMLETQVLPVFREKLGHRYDQCIYQQDGASPHRSRVAMDFLKKEFGDRLIALNSRAKHEWPAHSPDLNPLVLVVYAHSPQPTRCSYHGRAQDGCLSHM